MTAPAPEKCDVCGASPVEVVLYPVVVHYKGSGFYSTDYGKGKAATRRRTAAATPIGLELRLRRLVGEELVHRILREEGHRERLAPTPVPARVCACCYANHHGYRLEDGSEIGGCQGAKVQRPHTDSGDKPRRTPHERGG